MSIHLIMPMGGSGSRFSERGFSQPKPLIPINNRPFFYWATESVNKFTKLCSLTFVVLKEHVERFDIDKSIRQYYPDAYLCILEHVLNGAVLTCLEGVNTIKDTNPILFNDCDHIFTCREFYAFCKAGRFDNVDGALLSFTSNDPKYSYLEINDAGQIIRTAEKEAVSNQAVCGAYYFRNRIVFKQAADVYLNECTYEEYFVSGVYNIMVRQGAKIRCFTVDMHLPFGTPEEYDHAQKSEAFGVLV